MNRMLKADLVKLANKSLNLTKEYLNTKKKDELIVLLTRAGVSISPLKKSPKKSPKTTSPSKSPKKSPKSASPNKDDKTSPKKKKSPKKRAKKKKSPCKSPSSPTKKCKVVIEKRKSPAKSPKPSTKSPLVNKLPIPICNVSLREHQSRVVEHLRYNRGLIVNHHTGSGKCHAAGTPIFMYDGTIKPVENVIIGDQLMGEDSTVRNVLSLATGTDILYKISSYGSDDYLVNGDHILVLRDSTYNIIEKSVNDIIIENPPQIYYSIRTGVIYPTDDNTDPTPDLYYDIGFNSIDNPIIPLQYKTANWKSRLHIVSGFLDRVATLDRTDWIYRFTLLESIDTTDIVFICRESVVTVNKVRVLIEGIYYINYEVSGSLLYILSCKNPDNIIPTGTSMRDTTYSLLTITPDVINNYYGFVLDGNSRYLLGDSTVTHNTLSAIATSQDYLERNPNGKIVIVTPLSLQDNFKKGMRFYGIAASSNPHYEFYTLNKFASTFDKQSCGKNTLLIIDEAHNLRTDIVKAKRVAKKRIQGASPSKAGSPNKSPSKAGPPKKKVAAGVVRAEVAIRCAKRVDKVLLLTATSVYNNPRDIANLVAMVKGEDPPTEYKFNKIMNDPRLFDEFFACTISFYDKVDKEHFPTFSEYYMNVTMDQDYYKEYHKVELDQSDYFNDPWKFLQGMRQAANFINKCPKCSAVLDLVKNGKKTLIYSAYLTLGVQKMQELLDKANIKYAEITGEVKRSDRTLVVESYNNDEVNILFITGAGREGLDLKGTRQVVIFEGLWNKATEDQVVGRAIRSGSHTHLPRDERHVDIYYVVLVKPEFDQRYEGDVRPSIDEYMKEQSKKKERETDALLRRLYPLSIEHMTC